LQAIADHDACLDQPTSIRDKSSQLPHMRRWHPDFRHNSANEQFEQPLDIFLVRLHPGSHDLAYGCSIGYQDPAYQGSNDIIGLPYIRRRFQHHNISLAKILFRPLWKLLQADPAWREHPHLIFVLSTHQNVLAVDVAGQVSCIASCSLSFIHARLLLVRGLGRGFRV